MKKLGLVIFFAVFSVSQIAFAQEIKKIEKYCKKIDVEVDKFNGETKYQTPLLKQIGFTKIIKDGEEIVYMSIRTIGSTPSTGKGVIILLDNGEKIEKNVDTDVRVNSNAQFEHSAFFRLTKSDIELLKKHNITDTRLYIFDMKILKPVQYRAYMICLDDKK
ncbi:MAG: hypothetical protein ACPG4W_01165 [Flavobacteriales bacterium]